MNNFEELVAKMRNAQKRFYAAAAGSYDRKEIMKEAKILERAVDQELARMNAPEAVASNQLSILDQIPKP